MKHLLKLADLDKGDILDILNLADQLKYENQHGIEHHHLKGKTLGMIFQKSSTRTRVSFETGMYQLGGQALFLSNRDLQIGRGEPVQDTARVLSRYLDGIMIRTFAQKEVEDLAEYGSIPIINGLTDFCHPCQVLADLLTLYEHKGALAGKKLAFVGDATQVCVSLMFICSKIGMDFAQFGPKGHQICDGGLHVGTPEERAAFGKELMAIGEENCKVSGGTITISDDISCIEGADFVYTDVWYGLYDEEVSGENYMDVFYPKYQVTMDMMNFAGPNSKFMHCLPATRNEEVVDEVMDDPERSLCWVEAENRKHSIRALLAALGKRTPLNDEGVEYSAKAELHAALKALEQL